MSEEPSINGSELQGNAWMFASISDARAVYRSVLANPGLITDQHVSSLDTGFFAQRSVLVCLWGARVDADLVASIESLVIRGGGHELEGNLKQALLCQAQLRQTRLRRLALLRIGKGLIRGRRLSRVPPDLYQVRGRPNQKERV
jgi:hypothetical protein